MISHLGAMIPVVAGALMARRFRGETGRRSARPASAMAAPPPARFTKALNLAAVEKLPLVLVVANNQYAYSTPNDRQFACRDLVDQARSATASRATRVDGTDLAACLEVLGGAVRRARAGGGPQLVVASLLRLVGHGEHDDASYVDPALREDPRSAAIA